MQFLDKILYDKNIQDRALFLNPTLDDLYAPELNPFRLKNMSKVVKKVLSYISFDEPILIVGDYDVDGVTSTAILFDFLKFIGAKNLYYKIPLRHEGYGLSKSIIDYAHSIGVKLIITVDNGITAVEEVEYAKLFDISVCITDHHEPQSIIPDCLILNPKQPDCNYINKHLSGCGVVYKLIQAFACRLSIDYKFVEKYLPIVAVSTIGDMVSLTHENRLFTKLGYFLFYTCLSLKLLTNELKIKKLTFKDIAFSIVSTLNAPGRLDNASIAVNFLLSKKKENTISLLKKLINFNQQRKDITEQFTSLIINEVDNSNDYILHVIPPTIDIPEGVIGLIANKIKDYFNKPTILLLSDSNNFNLLKGSARSTPNFNIFEALSFDSSIFYKFGGHHYACGLSISLENIDKLKMLLSNIPLTQTTTVSYSSYKINPKDITYDLLDELYLLEPYGKDNESPYFILHSVNLSSFSLIGKSSTHAKFTLKKESQVFDCVFFNTSISSISRKNLYDVVFYPTINNWNNKIQLQVISIEQSK